jgi:hypothetical protein
MEHELGRSTFAPLAFAVLAVGAVFILFGSKRLLLPFFLFVGLVLPMANRLEIAGLAFMVHRILVVLGWARILLRGEYRDFTFNRIDWLLICLGFWGIVAYTVLWGTTNSFVYRSAQTIDMLGLYFFFRVQMRSWDDLYTTIRALAFTCLVVSGCMFLQFTTRTNPMHALGAPYDVVVSRLGVLRCQAGFGHPISAGVLGASLIPLFIAAWRMGSGLRRWAVIGIPACTVITITSASSSSVLVYAAGIGALLLWRFREKMRIIRWVVFLTLVGLHIIMQAPVWALLARVNVFGGSTGYHRYWLFNEFVNRFNEWWLIGLKSTADWNPLLWDVVNQYVLMGVRGGIIGLGLFIAILALCFREIGMAVRRIEPGDWHQYLVWAMGAMLFSHCVSFWSYDYWDQIIVLWYMLLAIIAGLGTIVPEAEAIQAEDDTEACSAEPVPAAS